MKVLLEIKDNRATFFMELISSLNYVSVLNEVKIKRNNTFISELKEAFDDVKLHDQGKKKLKTAKQLLNEL
jgi:hypothetical protein